MFDLVSLLRDNIKNIQPYSSARDEYTGAEGVFLDANENPLGSVCSVNVNRYPDPLQREIKHKLAPIKKVKPNNIFLGNGSDEPIDLLFRVFCNPGKDNVILLPPTYGMYKVCADINDISIKEVLLTKDYQINVDETLKAVNNNTKLIFVCSPNNPTGNLIHPDSIEKLLLAFNGLVVVDEAYIDFAENARSWAERLEEFPNLVVLQTFSKAWGMAALRCGMAFASEQIIAVLSKIKYPYNINQLTQNHVIEALDRVEDMNVFVNKIIASRSKLQKQLQSLSFVEHIYPSDANFLLIKVDQPKAIYDYLVENKVIIRDRSKVVLCEGCLRITIGTETENEALMNHLNQWSKR